MGVKVEIPVVLLVLCCCANANVTGYGYELIASQLGSLQGLESDLVSYTNQTSQQLSKLVALLTRLQLSQGSAPSPAGSRNVQASVGASCRNVPTRESGIYTIEPDFPFNEPMTVLCDQQYEGGGWTVIQRRLDGSVDFFRDWQDYKRGFGTLHGEFWLGLDNIHRLTNGATCELAVLLEDFDGRKELARYDRFRIAAETLNYAVTELGKCAPCGAGDSMRIHLNESFSTYDRDKSKAAFNCAAVFKGGWWFYRCHRCHLNGEYLRGDLPKEQDSRGIMWIDFRGSTYSLKSSTMMIRPIR